ncbi:hypothetical protein ERO13_A10G212266v2 [Gossypium hirsutum]|uniref:DUF674 domain-containing protein n=2 Tax=Gossypium TaxID=3633 RepID=A0A5D2NUT1_GOSTO|nr:hypothetical protein ERO13_A10G212266v2 [Gossypium hirsutum]TYH00233.1 hypothetical protein ES288_A10G258200v1 [Gossypium darwinii]TYI07851.1 hypothetical protein ES332_A10G254300v1 [Gossypium tomentosum]
MAATTTVRLKLLIDSKSKRVLFAEAGKDFVDFLFSILSMPVGAVIRLLTKQGMVRCLGNLYGSIENLGDTYMQSLANKDTLLKPLVSNYTANNVPLLFQNMKSSTTMTKLYGCSDYCCCTIALANQRSKGSTSTEGGYVKGVVTYMVMDDLVVSPISKISSITLLNKFKFQDVGGIKLLRASLQSNMVLTVVYLGKEIKLFLK